jgi:hypothetical protein
MKEEGDRGEHHCVSVLVSTKPYQAETFQTFSSVRLGHVDGTVENSGPVPASQSAFQVSTLFFLLFACALFTFNLEYLSHQ